MRTLARHVAAVAAAALLWLVPGAPAAADALPRAKVADRYICWELKSEKPPPNSLAAATTTTRCPVSVKLSAPAGQPVVIWYTTRPGTARPQVDYLDVPRASLTIPAGALEGYAVVEIVPDQEKEPEETFALILLEASGAVIEVQVGVQIIRDGAPPQLR